MEIAPLRADGAEAGMTSRISCSGQAGGPKPVEGRHGSHSLSCLSFPVKPASQESQEPLGIELWWQEASRVTKPAPGYLVAHRRMSALAAVLWERPAASNSQLAASSEVGPQGQLGKIMK